MLAMLADHKVDFLSEETIEEFAWAWRRTAQNENLSYFNIVDFIKFILFVKTKQPFKIKFINIAPGEKPGYVEFKPERTLFIDQETWDLAELGDPEARYVLAHEIGHLIMHDHRAKAFSNDPTERIKAWQPEESAEWQAHTFAAYFLLPTRLVAAFNDLERLSTACAVPKEIAKQRMDAVYESKRARVVRDGAICPDCGNFTLDSGSRCVSSDCKGA